MELTWRVGLAAVEACDRVAGVTARLKWPNDVLVDGAKLAGILAQRGVRAGRSSVGIGLNVGWAPDGRPGWVTAIDPGDVLGRAARAFDRLPADVRPRYRGTLARSGRQVRVELPDRDPRRHAPSTWTADGRLVVLDAARP